MKKIYTLLLVILMGFTTVNAQDYKRIDSCSMVFIYTYQFFETHKDPTSLKKQEMILETGKRCSKFYSSASQLLDSLAILYAGEPVETASAKIFPQVTNQSSHKYASFFVYKDYPKPNTTLFTASDMGALNDYEVAEELDFGWKIDGNTQKKVLGYSCAKATCHFAGRDYEAWFTTEIPINDGPYKFKGLPGLIVKIADSDEEHVFELQEVKNIKMKPMYLRKREYIKADGKGYVKALEASKAKYIDDLSAMIASDESRLRAISRVQKRNNFIEQY